MYRLIALALLLALNIEPAYSQSSGGRTEALKDIADFADRICTKIPMDMSKSEYTLSAEGKIELSKLIKKLADAGIQGAGSYKGQERFGLLDNDVAAAIKGADDCRLKVMDKLIDKFFPNQTPPPAAKNSPHEAVLRELRRVDDIERDEPAGGVSVETIRIRSWQLPQEWPGPNLIVIVQEGSAEEHMNGKIGLMRSISFCQDSTSPCQILDLRSRPFTGRIDNMLQWDGAWFKVEIQGSPKDIPGLSLRLIPAVER